jgi:hypothetical protein
MNKIGAVILSRQQLRPSLKNSWVKNSVEAIKWLKKNNYSIISSVGMSTWELITSLAVEYSLPLRLVLPCTDEYNFNQQIEYYSNEFKLNFQQTEVIPLINDEKTESTIWQQRDNYILNKADIILPISIRKNGFFDRIINNSNQTELSINHNFTSEYEKKIEIHSYRISEDELNPEFKKLKSDYICHWTRTSNSKWPNETLYDYYSAISSSKDYPRSAFETLKRIVLNNTIISSSKNIENKQSVVSFSGCSPAQMLPLMRWRSRYKQMSFEPYGIGIEKETALSVGIVPVKYYDRNGQNNIEEIPSWQRQSNGVISDWTKENEYRYNGNFDLSKISDKKKILICRFKKEADELSQLTGLKSISFTNQ